MILPEEHSVTLSAASAADVEALVALRISAMRPSLERIGRFDAQRARQRFMAGYTVAATRHIVVDGRRVGFVVLKTGAAQWLLDHLYLRPESQGRGIGAAVLVRLFAEADAVQAVIRVGALRDSDANRFYQRHGFVLVEEAEWDLYYVRPASAPAPAAGS
jgi:GNAT superfamily N-acetyltransferase